MGEVEAKSARVDDAAGLFHVIPKHVTESGMEQVRCGVIPHGRFALFVVDAAN